MKKFLFFATMLMSTSVWAACGGIRCEQVYVDRLYPSTSGSIYIGTSGDEKNLACSPNGGVYLTLSPTDPNADHIYSTLLAAQLAGKKVHIRVSENSTGCGIVYMTLDR